MYRSPLRLCFGERSNKNDKCTLLSYRNPERLRDDSCVPFLQPYVRTHSKTLTMCRKQVQLETEALHNKEGNAANRQELNVLMPADILTTCLNVAGFVHAAVICAKEHRFGNTEQPQEGQEPLSDASQVRQPASAFLNVQAALE